MKKGFKNNEVPYMYTTQAPLTTHTLLTLPPYLPNSNSRPISFSLENLLAPQQTSQPHQRLDATTTP